MKIIFYGKIIDFKFVPDNLKVWMVWLEKNDKKKVVLEVSEDRAKRSLDQNAYYFAYL